ncbi:MAG: hypothetical protein ABW026_03240 [Microvirga sp.]
MVESDSNIRGLGLPNTLELSSDHTMRVVGHLLRRHFGDPVDTALPERLQGLVAALDARERLEMHASER